MSFRLEFSGTEDAPTVRSRESGTLGGSMRIPDGETVLLPRVAGPPETAGMTCGRRLVVQGLLEAF
jgi:hypothetical protein